MLTPRKKLKIEAPNKIKWYLRSRTYYIVEQYTPQHFYHSDVSKMGRINVTKVVHSSYNTKSHQNQPPEFNSASTCTSSKAQRAPLHQQKLCTSLPDINTHDIYIYQKEVSYLYFINIIVQTTVDCSNEYSSGRRDEQFGWSGSVFM